MRTSGRLILLVAWLGLPASARADMLDPDGLYLSLGMVAAYSDGQAQGRSGLWGGEMSAVVFRDDWWFGGFADVARLRRAARLRLSVGPELGWGPLGLDGGYTWARGPRGARHGGNVRVLFSLALISAYGRVGWLRGEGRYGEVGLLLKVPLRLLRGRLPRRRGAPPSAG